MITACMLLLLISVDEYERYHGYGVFNRDSYSSIFAIFNSEFPPEKLLPKKVATIDLANSGPITLDPSVTICALLLVRAFAAE